MKITGTVNPITDPLVASIKTAVEAHFNGSVVSTNSTTAGTKTYIFGEPGDLTSLHIALPPITNDNINQEYIIVDSAGTGATKPLVVTPFSGDTINGAGLGTVEAAFGKMHVKAVKLTKWVKL